MNLKFYEKLIYEIIVFIGVVVITAYIIGVYNNKVKAKETPVNSIILESINLF